MSNLRAKCLLLLVGLSIFSLTPRAAIASDAQADSAPELLALAQGNNDLFAGRNEQAEESFKKAAKLAKGDCEACYFGLAVAQDRLGFSDDALKNCDKAMLQANTDVRRAADHVLKGNILSETENSPKLLKDAESEYRAALQLEPNAAIAHLNLGVTLLRESQDAEGLRELSIYLQMDPMGEQAELARQLLIHPRQAGKELAPNFQVVTLQGATISLAQLRGKIVVLDFWATWCPPCRGSVPELKDLTRKYPSDKLVLLSISGDRHEAEWRDFVSKEHMDWSQYLDGNGQMIRKFRIFALPTYVVIDQDGFIEQRIMDRDPQKSISARLKTYLQRMLAAPSGN
ncbi:MAG: redoxin domain-containing protein [Candidatus Acidiferrales bacterium]